MKFVTDIHSKYKDIILEAIRISGRNIIYDDVPMDIINLGYGSLWTDELNENLQKFWSEFDRLKKESALI